jgi:hypothetical protein
MLYQTDPRLNKYINKYGCYFMCLAYYREKYQGLKWNASAINEIWQYAIDYGYITGDLNLDGDFDDAGQLEIKNPNALCGLLGCGLRYVDGHFPIDSPLAQGCYTVTAWYNPRTRFTHFVQGSKRPVEYDPIEGGSITVREGAPKSDGLRIYQMLSWEH